jgi:hypothetical protein
VNAILAAITTLSAEISTRLFRMGFAARVGDGGLLTGSRWNCSQRLTAYAYVGFLIFTQLVWSPDT